MPKLLKHSSQINVFILYAAFYKQPVLDSYKKLCAIMPDDRIDYVDFEWKYYQYYHGNRDLTIERSSDNSSPLTLSNLPVDALEMIVEKLPLIERLVLRKVSPSLRNLVDSTSLSPEEVNFCIGDNFSEMKHKDWSLGHYEIGVGDCEIVANRSWSRKISVTKKHSNFEKVMIADTATLLKNPTLKIEHLECKNYRNLEFSEMFKFLKSLNFKLDVRAVVADRSIVPVLQLLKPKKMEEFSYVSHYARIDELNEIAETEQWLNAWKFRWNEFPKVFHGMAGRFQMEKLLHFKEIEIERFEFSDQNLIMIRDFLLKSPHFEFCRFLMDYNSQDWEINVDRIMSQDPAYKSGTGRFSIPNSRDYFQLQYERGHNKPKLTITRISKN